jgi:hypothetical protein
MKGSKMGGEGPLKGIASAVGHVDVFLVFVMQLGWCLLLGDRQGGDIEHII